VEVKAGWMKLSNVHWNDFMRVGARMRISSLMAIVSMQARGWPAFLDTRHVTKAALSNIETSGSFRKFPLDLIAPAIVTSR
jgi:hypothetical protein